MKNLIKQFLQDEITQEDLATKFGKKKAHAINSYKMLYDISNIPDMTIDDMAEKISRSIDYEQEES